MVSTPLASRSVQHDGVTTHYTESAPGSARTLLLVHDGWFGADAHTLWWRVAEELAEDFRILAPDMLGFGRTDKAVYHDRSMYRYRAAHLGSFLRAVCEPGEEIHAVGTSMGGSILLRDAVADPPAVPARSIVSISGSGGPWRSAFGTQELGTYGGTVDDIRRVMDHMSDDFDGRDAVIDERHANTGIRGHVECLLAGSLRGPVPSPPPAPDPWPEPLRELGVPVLVLAGRRDPLLEPDWQTHLDDLSPLLTTRAVDTRHAPSLDHPRLVAELVREHVGRAVQHATVARGGQR